MKKVLALLLCASMSISMLVGCGSKEEAPSTEQETVSEGEEKVTITIGLPQNTLVQDYDTNAYTLWLEETTGYDIEFYLFASGASDYRSQLSTMVAGGEKLPDMLWNMNLGGDVYRQYGEDGYLVNLAPYYADEEKSAVFWERVENIYPEEFKEYVKANLAEKNTENIWAMPRIECTMIDGMDYMVFINKQWLDNLGLDMPTDPESLYNVAKAFVNEDPNGNGQKDEIGIIGTDANGKGFAIGWLVNMFENTWDRAWWNVDEDGQLYLPYVTDEYREALIYINKLVSEGIMPDSCWSMTNADIKALINPAEGPNTVGIWTAHPSLVLEAGNESFYEYAALPVWGYPVMNNNTFEKKAFITTDCENPDAVWELYMAMCSEEGSLRQRYGEKGVDWVEAEPGTKSFIGLDAEINVLNQTAFGASGNQCWNATSATIVLDSENEKVQVSEDTDEWTKRKLDLMADCYDTYYAAIDSTPTKTAPVLVYTPEESELTQIERENCQTWIKTMRSSFCCGTEGNDPNDDADWQAYVDAFENLGFETWRAQAQEIYDAQK